ncbi:PDZ domain-containing protein [Clostridium bovifaecis]|uniref:PDZ domain-containing protein n=1 Tax=Clostridium bovifaecis TaxID=2184719 RepID=A0A6I6EU02_9CLOT|nr:PDZ domain-containing protein [Clostridium bovifaecis]
MGDIMKLFKAKNIKNKGISILAALSIFFSSLSFLYINANAVETIPLSEAKSLIENYYLNPVSDEVLNSSSIEDMVKELNDPYSSYFTKEEYQEFVNAIDNKFCGIGVQILTDGVGIKITNVIKGSPAEEIGLKAGDIITKVNNINLSGLAVEQAITYIKGEEGTNAHLTVIRDGSSFEIDAIRREISLPTVVGEVLGNNVGYIEVSSFGENTPYEFKNALDQLEEADVKSYIVDLRYNPGGYVQAALDIGGYFVGNNPLMIMENSAGYKAAYKGYNHDNIIEKPIIFLINEYSASASEILSAALKDYKKAFFIGKTTYGKGVAQNMFPLSDGSFLKITTNEFLSPYGNTINHVGISPDLPVDEENVDFLDLAYLLSSGMSSKDEIETSNNKAGYVKLELNNKSFYIDLKEARKAGFLETYRYIIKNIDAKNLFLGQGERWVNFSYEDLKDEVNLIYPGSKILKSIDKDKKDKTFNITFNKAIDARSINNENVELINAANGERIDTNITVTDGNRVTLNLKDELKDSTYYLVISDKVKDSGGKKLNKETVVKITSR